MRARGTAALLLILAGVAVPSAHAHPRYRRELAEYFGPPLAKKLNSCRTCHVTRGTDDEANGRLRNPFGVRLHEVRDDLRKGGKKTKIPNRIEAVADEDSDRDGVANAIELITGHFPGEADDIPSADEVARGKADLDAFKRSHGAAAWNPFEPVRRPVLPEVGEPGRALHPIGAFIAEGRAARGLSDRPDAPRAVLLRRVTPDLTGLPPSPEELHASLEDRSPDAYEAVVHRLLASPRPDAASAGGGTG